MKLLFDTHTILWLVNEPQKLSNTVQSLYLDKKNDIYLSDVSIWEIAIKSSSGKLHIEGPLKDFVKQHVRGNDINIYPISTEHFYKLVNLPYHHRDPFDRLLISQCLDEKMPILSADTILDQYGVRRIW